MCVWGGGVQRGPPSPLVPRLGVRRCVTDEAVPANLRCATVVVGKRLLLFPKGKDGMCDLQFAMVMDCGSLRLWALRVMGALPLRCRCGFHVVGESVCVVPEDSAGRCELRQTLVLTAPEEDRIYSQGCFVEQDVPACTHADLRVVGRSCLIFPHDGEGAYDYDATCLLDTELLTLRAVGRAAAPVPAELAPPAQGRCQVAVAGWKAVLFPQTEARECVLAEAAVLDTNLGMLQQRVRLADPARPPPQAQSTLLVSPPSRALSLLPSPSHALHCLLMSVSLSLSPHALPQYAPATDRRGARRWETRCTSSRTTTTSATTSRTCGPWTQVRSARPRSGRTR